MTNSSQFIWTEQKLAEKLKEFRPFGLPMHINGFKRLWHSNEASHLCIPRYDGRDFFYLLNKLRFVGFCGDLVHANRHTYVVDRRMAEAAWWTLLKAMYLEWDPNELTKEFGEGNELEEKQNRLGEALAQRRDPAVDAFWEKRALRHTGLDVRDIPDNRLDAYPEDEEDDNSPWVPLAQPKRDPWLESVFGNEYFDYHGIPREAEDETMLVDESGGSDEEEDDVDRPSLPRRPLKGNSYSYVSDEEESEDDDEETNKCAKAVGHMHLGEDLCEDMGGPMELED